LTFCPRCGKYSESNYCPDCGIDLRAAGQYAYLRDSPSLQPQARASGSIGLGALAGFLLLVFLNFIPILGALISGFVAGLVARGAGRGAVAGFLAGILGAVILTLLLTVGGAAIGGILGLAGVGGLFGGLVGGTAVLLSLGNAILCLIGGLVGGALRRR
jgi:hypothetical protein